LLAHHLGNRNDRKSIHSCVSCFGAMLLHLHAKSTLLDRSAFASDTSILMPRNLSAGPASSRVDCWCHLLIVIKMTEGVTFVTIQEKILIV
jgi:hypothetical protein